MMKIILFIFLSLFSVAVSGQEINEYLVLPDVTCSQDSPCRDTHAHCNPKGECQCNFHFFPTTETNPPSCDFFLCNLDSDCLEIYGPNSYCKYRNGDCYCRDGWQVDPKTQSCILPKQ